MRAPLRAVKMFSSAPRRAGREVDGPDQPVLTLDVDQRVALVPHVVAGGHHVGAGIKDVLEDCLGDAETGGGVLAVHDDEVDGVGLHQARKRVHHGLAAAASDQIAKKQKTHVIPRPRRNRRSCVSVRVCRPR